MDLVHGHICALKKLTDPKLKGFKTYNLGTGKGHSVLEVCYSLFIFFIMLFSLNEIEVLLQNKIALNWFC